MSISLRLLLCVLLLLATLTQAILGDDTKGKTTQPQLEDKSFQMALPSCAIIYSVKQGQSRIGSGVLVDARRRLLVTNDHCVPEGTTTVVLFSQQTKNGAHVKESKAYIESFKAKGGIAGKVVARSEKQDLALLQLDKVPANAKAMPFAKEAAQAGAPISWIGNPKDHKDAFIVTRAHVLAVESIKTTMNNSKVLDCKVIFADVEGIIGESGAPLFNSQGELLGIRQGETKITKDGRSIPVAACIDLSEVTAFLKLHAPAPKVIEPKTDPDKDKDKGKDKLPFDSEKTAMAKLMLAKTLHEAGKVEKAAESLQDLIARHPMTKAAEEAGRLLREWKK